LALVRSPPPTTPGKAAQAVGLKTVCAVPRRKIRARMVGRSRTKIRPKTRIARTRSPAMSTARRSRRSARTPTNGLASVGSSRATRTPRPRRRRCPRGPRPEAPAPPWRRSRRRTRALARARAARGRRFSGEIAGAVHHPSSETNLLEGPSYTPHRIPSPSRERPYSRATLQDGGSRGMRKDGAGFRASGTASGGMRSVPMGKPISGP